ncbi:MAG TPA: hypothetical protein PLU22_06940 [Polyangiaceae bacterium]|nr:hypothetical protein [Polyangiaceae bacterium]
MPRKPKPILATNDRREALEEIKATVATLAEPATWEASCARPGAVTRFLVDVADAWRVMRRRSGPDDASWELALATWELVFAGPERPAFEKWRATADELAGRPLEITIEAVRAAFDKRRGLGSDATVARALFKLSASKAPEVFTEPHGDKRRGSRGPLAELLKATRWMVESRPT